MSGELVGKSARRPRVGRLPGPPPYVGLCPVHTREFYMPMAGPVPQPCPEPGCPAKLVVYKRISDAE